MNSKESHSTRSLILKSANRLVLEEGVSKLTLDNVARLAGVSKGGLLYHFPSKKALILGMIENLISKFNDNVKVNIDDQDNKSGQFLRSYLKSTFTDSNLSKEMNTSLLAAVANNPALLEPIRQHYYQWQQQIEKDGIDPILATIIRLAADGLWYAEFFDLAPPNNQLRSHILERLLQMTKKETM
ncbi:TetR/AcrR family transcriptional regulator [Thermoflavimicrobium daqui]|uniref:TetR family transcriptional regulator n=1 Tax=Thermoflavimicrobium daqui TaxID=2137476 RepID=A0A364K456_9BACL|nr:TetR/AcrR family transcriptional regulator [Thermoflavimicrobium daqui]RAL24145.1 TetR family transcriptional regulator [Thermoflavimicrobium daqui]